MANANSNRKQLLAVANCDSNDFQKQLPANGRPPACRRRRQARHATGDDRKQGGAVKTRTDSRKGKGWRQSRPPVSRGAPQELRLTGLSLFTAGIPRRPGRPATPSRTAAGAGPNPGCVLAGGGCGRGRSARPPRGGHRRRGAPAAMSALRQGEGTCSCNKARGLVLASRREDLFLRKGKRTCSCVKARGHVLRQDERTAGRGGGRLASCA